MSVTKLTGVKVRSEGIAPLTTAAAAVGAAGKPRVICGRVSSDGMPLAVSVIKWIRASIVVC